jgi:hypothetical protein
MAYFTRSMFRNIFIVIDADMYRRALTQRVHFGAGTTELSLL